MRPGDCGRKDQILQPTRIAAQGRGFIPDISRVEPAAAARRRAMTPYCEYCEWPATQRMRSAWLARRVGIFQHHRLRKGLRSREQTELDAGGRLPDHVI
jgi:hypothetical protein